jgi:hypothetical protein
VCYDFFARYEIVTAVLQKTQAFWEIVLRRFEGSWCLLIHSQAAKERINDPSKFGKYLQNGTVQHAGTLETYDLTAQ